MFLMSALVCGLSAGFPGSDENGCRLFVNNTEMETLEMCEVTLTQLGGLQSLYTYLLENGQEAVRLVSYSCIPKDVPA
jgi:hypothetical protein